MEKIAKEFFPACRMPFLTNFTMTCVLQQLRATDPVHEDEEMDLAGIDMLKGVMRDVSDNCGVCLTGLSGVVVHVRDKCCLKEQESPKLLETAIRQSKYWGVT